MLSTAFRTVVPYRAELLDQPRFVENRPGSEQVIGIDAVASSSDEFSKKIKREIDLCRKIVRDNQIKPD